MTRVAVVGAYGRMGSASCRAIEDSDDLKLAARVGSGDSLDALAGAEVIVDFTTPDVVMGTLDWCIAHGVHAVVGTSGFDDDRLAELRSRVSAAPELGILVVPNFSIGAVLMMRFAQQAAAYFESAEIVEMHHPDKVDAPSGTAARTAAMMEQARTDAGLGAVPDATTSDPDGARGAAVGGIHVHSVRLRGAVAHQQVLFGGVGETLTIRHDSTDRNSFMPGVLAAVREVPKLPGVTVGLDTVLGLQ